jgi:hypothetical protein
MEAVAATIVPQVEYEMARLADGDRRRLFADAERYRHPAAAVFTDRSGNHREVDPLVPSLGPYGQGDVW